MAEYSDLGVAAKKITKMILGVVFNMGFKRSQRPVEIGIKAALDKAGKEGFTAGFTARAIEDADDLDEGGE